MVNKGEAYTVAGHYLDTYRRHDGRWLFLRRDFRTYHWVPLSRGCPFACTFCAGAGRDAWRAYPPLGPRISSCE